MTPRMNGGAVKEERSPLKLAMDYGVTLMSIDIGHLFWLTLRKDVQEPFDACGMAPPSSCLEDDDIVCFVSIVYGSSRQRR